MKEDLMINWVDINSLRENEYNPRTINRDRLEQLKVLLKEGWKLPLVVNKAKGRENILIDGHQRLVAARELGMGKVPVVYIDEPDIQKEKQYNLQLNLHSGDWVKIRLAKYEKKLLEIVGFRDKEISSILKTMTSKMEKPEIDFTKELLHENNYVVFAFDNKLDWNVVVEKLGIKSVKSLDSVDKYERIGIGRVLDGKKLLGLLK